MKVILIEDVKSLGKKGQLVDVNDGYARNFILAKKLGLEATPKNLNDLKLKKQNEEKGDGICQSIQHIHKRSNMICLRSLHNQPIHKTHHQHIHHNQPI